MVITKVRIKIKLILTVNSEEASKKIVDIYRKDGT